MENTILPETALLLALRLFLFFACRKYLLRSLHSELQKLSLALPNLTELPTESEIELESLPPPSTQANPTSYPTDLALFHSTVSRTLFSLSFTESCMMFFLLMLQGADTLSPSTRLLNWRISLIFLMSIILVLVPLCLSFLVGSASGQQGSWRGFLGRKIRMLLSLISVGLYLFVLSKIPLPAALATSDSMTSALSRLIVLGTIILGLLSGLGAINNSWTFIPMLARSVNEPTDQDVSTAEYALQSIRNDLRDRTAEAERRVGTSEEGSWFTRVVPNFREDDHLRELRGLQALEYQMSRNLEALRIRRNTAKYAKTIRGRIFNFGGQLFAIYCIIRIVSSIVNLLFPTRRSSSTTSYPDLITDLLAHALSFVSPVDVDFEKVALFSRQLSLGLVGIIILTNIRLVLRGVARALRVTSRNLGTSFMMLLLAQLMGVYLLSTIVQLRTSFPPPPVQPDQDPVTMNLFSTIPEFEVFGSLFDWSFLIAAGVYAFLRWGAERVNGAGV